MAYMLSPFDVHLYLPGLLKGRQFQSEKGEFYRGVCGSFKQFRKGMSLCLEISYRAFRGFWLGSDFRLLKRSGVGASLLAKNSRTPQFSRFTASSLTIFAVQARSYKRLYGC